MIVTAVSGKRALNTAPSRAGQVASGPLDPTPRLDDEPRTTIFRRCSRRTILAARFSGGSSTSNCGGTRQTSGTAVADVDCALPGPAAETRQVTASAASATIGRHMLILPPARRPGRLAVPSGPNGSPPSTI